MEIPGLSNNTTENLKQKKIISLAAVDQATDESSCPYTRISEQTVPFNTKIINNARIYLAKSGKINSGTTV